MADYKHCDGCGLASANAAEYGMWIQVLDQSAEPPMPSNWSSAMLEMMRGVPVRPPGGFFEFCSWRCVAAAAMIKSLTTEPEVEK